jgi:hypothetical protein
MDTWIDWRVALVFFLLQLPFYIWFFPNRTKKLSGLSGNPKPIIDVWYAYTPARVFGLINALGPEGRRLYALSELTLDLVYPLIYTPFLLAMLGLVVPPALPGSWLADWLPRLPLALMVSDYCENACLVSLLKIYPRQPQALAWLASGITTLKNTILAICLLGILAGGAVLVFQ